MPTAPPELAADNLDAYTVLNLPPKKHSLLSLTIEQVRKNYRLLAMQLHPDKRPRGMTHEQATQMFQVLTNAYRTVIDDLNQRQIDRPFHELRADAQSSAAHASTPTQSSAAPLGSGEKFDTKRFNQVFERVNVPHPEMEGGYGVWMTKSLSQKDFDYIENKRNIQQRQLRTLSEPEPMGVFSKKATSYTELGTGVKSDYSGRIERARMDFTDYRLAHTTSRLADPDEVTAADRKSSEFKSLEQIKIDRSQISHNMNANELELYNRRQAFAQAQEQKRLRSMELQDQRISKSYAIANQLLLSNH